MGKLYAFTTFIPQKDKCGMHSLTEIWSLILIEGSATHPVPFKDKFKPLQFVHLSDVHMVLDLYYDIEIRIKWLKNILADAKEKGLYVITAMHEPSGNINDTYGE